MYRMEELHFEIIKRRETVLRVKHLATERGYRRFTILKTKGSITAPLKFYPYETSIYKL
jgi:hypothetical protein